MLDAVLDKCGICTGGTTGKISNYLQDCAGFCDRRYQLDQCKVCQLKDAKYKRNFTDCAGVCFGKARLDICNVCSGGNTGIKQNSTLDICNKCNGDNTTCGGCNKRSGKEFDFCGNCLFPSDKNYNALCFELRLMQPTAALSSGGEEISISGAGFTDDMICLFKSQSNQVYNTVNIQGNFKSNNHYYNFMKK